MVARGLHAQRLVGDGGFQVVVDQEAAPCGCALLEADLIRAAKLLLFCCF